MGRTRKEIMNAMPEQRRQKIEARLQERREQVNDDDLIVFNDGATCGCRQAFTEEDFDGRWGEHVVIRVGTPEWDELAEELGII